MPTVIRDNERSYAIDLISQINSLAQRYTLQIKCAGGERTISTSRNSRMFPDVMLYGDETRTQILQGWELKLPDTLITDEVFIKDAQRKAVSLGLNSCFIWNFSAGVLYIKDRVGAFQIAKQWNITSHIRSRADVETYRADWEKAIQKIILELNQYFIDGEITSASLGEIISDSVIAMIIERNKSLVAAELKSQSIVNTVMGAGIDVWWSEVGIEFAADEQDKYNAYAKIVILNWTNRIVFAHLIKRLHNAASRVENITLDISATDANVIFASISAECDFFNIFSSLDYNQFVPQDTWSDLMELNQFLIENGIDEIEQTTLQTILENSVSTTKRELAGQFTTPTILADLLGKLTVLDWSKPCLDPCCGTGSIPQAILNQKKTRLDITAAVQSTWASDKFAYPLQVANISLTSPETINEPIRIFKHNVFNMVCGENIEIVNPVDGSLMDITIPKYGTIASNLPFIPFESISGDDLRFANQVISEVAENTGHILSGRSDIYCSIIFSLHKLLDSNGRVGVITSNSWLGTVWGNIFFKAVQHYFAVNQVHISGNGRWFQNAQVVTVILVLTKKNAIEPPQGTEQLSFFRWNRTLSEIEDDVLLSDSIVRSALLNRELDAETLSLSSYSNEQIEILLSLNISLNALFHGVIWLQDIKDSLVPINKVFQVIRGERRGWDDMFYPAPNHGIEPDYIKQVLKNARGVKTLIVTADSDAFCCSETTDELQQRNHTGALNWIRRFEGGVNGTGKPLPQVLAKANMHWYEMKDSSTADICTTMNPDQRLFYSRFEEPTFINQRLIGLRKNPEFQDAELNHALLNSIVGMFFIEAAGFGRGLGALDISKKSVEQTFMLDPRLVSVDDRAIILEKFAVVCSRDVMNTLQELQQRDRIEFDKSVLQAFGIINYYDNIKDSLISMQKSRLSVR